MRTSVLHDFAKDWPKVLGDAIEAAFEADELETSDLRTIVFSLDGERQRVGIWLSSEWDNYPQAENSQSAQAFVSLGGWLDEVDAVARGERTFVKPPYVPKPRPIVFDDPQRNQSWSACWGRLHEALLATAREIATVRFAARFSQPVGVFVTMDGQTARLVA